MREKKPQPKKFVAKKEAVLSVRKIVDRRGYVYKTGDYLTLTDEHGSILTGTIDLEGDKMHLEGGEDKELKDILHLL